MKYREVNFDGLVGPNHNYAGLAQGNLASATNSKNTSYPKAAALQGLEKMKALFELGLTQGILPPLQRPDLVCLKKLGFTGKPKKIISKAANAAPELLAAVYSSSSMWTANAATVSPSCDTKDKRLHLTPANLNSNFHRSIEMDHTHFNLKQIFNNKKLFEVHQPLPQTEELADEGSANHMRLSSKDFSKGLELFVYGKKKAEFPVKNIQRDNTFPHQGPLFANISSQKKTLFSSGKTPKLLIREFFIMMLSRPVTETFC